MQNTNTARLSAGKDGSSSALLTVTDSIMTLHHWTYIQPLVLFSYLCILPITRLPHPRLIHSNQQTWGLQSKFTCCTMPSIDRKGNLPRVCSNVWVDTSEANKGKSFPSRPISNWSIAIQTQKKQSGIQRISAFGAKRGHNISLSKCVHCPFANPLVSHPSPSLQCVWISNDSNGSQRWQQREVEDQLQ